MTIATLFPFVWGQKHKSIISEMDEGNIMVSIGTIMIPVTTSMVMNFMKRLVRLC